MVGTFYTAPAPDADPYVSLNEKIRTGQVVCIVEAMKLMNEIESEIAGRVAEILVDGRDHGGFNLGKERICGHVIQIGNFHLLKTSFYGLGCDS